MLINPKFFNFHHHSITTIIQHESIQPSRIKHYLSSCMAGILSQLIKKKKRFGSNYLVHYYSSITWILIGYLFMKINLLHVTATVFQCVTKFVSVGCACCVPEWFSAPFFSPETSGGRGYIWIVSTPSSTQPRLGNEGRTCSCQLIILPRFRRH